MRRRDRIKSEAAQQEHHDDRSVITSTTEEPSQVTTRTLHAQQVEVLDLDRGHLVDRVVEFVSSSVIVRAMSRTGSVGSIVACVLGGGAISFFRFTDTGFFALSDSDVPQLVCLPKRTSPKDFQMLVENTLKTRCIAVAHMMGTLSLDALTMTRIWKVASGAPTAFHEVSAIADASFGRLLGGTEAFVDEHRVSAAESHLNAAVDNFTRLLNESSDITIVTMSLRRLSEILRAHRTAGRLSGALPYVHTICALLSAMAFGNQTMIKHILGEVSEAIVSASAAIVDERMEVVVTREAAASIAESIIALNMPQSAMHAPIAFACCSAAALLSVAAEDCLLETLRTRELSNVHQAAIFREMVLSAKTVICSVHQSLRRQRFTTADDVAGALASLVAPEVHFNDELPAIPQPFVGTVEALWIGMNVISCNARRFADSFATTDDNELRLTLTSVFCELPALATRSLLVLSLVALHSWLAPSLLLRWFSEFSSLFRRANTLCGLLGITVANGATTSNVPHKVTGALVYAATTLILTKALLIPTIGTNNAGLSSIAHQWLVKLGIFAGPNALFAVVAALDEFHRTVLERFASSVQAQVWEESRNVFEGLGASVPSPSPMLMMWEQAIDVARHFQELCRRNNFASAKRLASWMMLPEIRDFNGEQDHGALIDAETYLKEYPWEGAKEHFDSCAPPDVSVSIEMLKHTASPQTPLSSFAKFGLKPAELALLAPCVAYTWPAMISDSRDGRRRALATHCLALSSEIRRVGAPTGLVRFLAAFGGLMRTNSGSSTSDSVAPVIQAFGDNLNSWCDPVLALHLSSVAEGKSVSSQAPATENNIAGNAHLPHSVRIGHQANTGKPTVLDRVSLAYAP
jgi:hypothetical protein